MCIRDSWKAVAMCAATVMVYGALFQTLGFWLATILMAVPVGMAFGGTLKNTLIGGVGSVSYTHLDVYKRQRATRSH